MECEDVPIQELCVGKNPMPASTHTAQVVKPYMNPSGRYVTTLQQYRSHFLAQVFRRRFNGGGEGDDDGARVAIFDESREFATA